MLTRFDVLLVFEESETGETSLTAYELSRRRGCSMKSAAKQLAGLWRGQLIETTKPRLRGAPYRLRAGERMETLQFRLTERGHRRLRWYRDEERAPSVQGTLSFVGHGR